MPEFKGYGSRKKGAKAARAYIGAHPDTMGIDVSAGEIPSEWTSQLDVRGQEVGGRQIGEDWAQRQRELADMQTAAARGEGPSAAEGVLQRGMERGIAAQHSASMGLPPSMRAFGARGAAANVSDISQGAALDAATLRAQEMQQAQQNLGQTVGMGREQEMRAQQMNDSMTQFYMEQGFSRDAAQAQANLAIQEMMAGNWRTMIEGLMTPESSGGAGQALGGMFTGAGMALGGFLSDERAKTEIKDAKKLLDDFVDKLEPKEFEYKFEPGKKTFGIMAQDLEKSEVGKSLVLDSGPLKVVDAKKGIGTALAALKRLAERMNKLEEAHAV